MGNNTTLVTYNAALGESRLQVQFEPVPEEGHYGYIKHVPSGKYVHPRGGNLDPGNDTELVYHDGKHAACLFAFDETNNYIVHKGSGKIWHPYGGSPSPGNDTPCVLHIGRHDAATFMMVNSSGAKISPYPELPTLSGKWALLQATVKARADHTYEISFEIGQERTSTKTVHNAWSITAEVAEGMFSASATYSGFVEQTNSQTWGTKKTTKRTIHITKGETVATWQYCFGITRYGDKYEYLSSIIEDTDSPTSPPKK